MASDVRSSEVGFPLLGRAISAFFFFTFTCTSPPLIKGVTHAQQTSARNFSPYRATFYSVKVSGTSFLSVCHH